MRWLSLFAGAAIGTVGAGLARAPAVAAQQVDTATARAADSATARAADSAAITPAMIEQGRKIFHGQGTCSTCHGEQLEGTAIAPTLHAHQWKDAVGGSYAAIEHVVSTGVNGTAMVSHPGGISDAMLAKVAAYVWAVSHENVRP